MARVPMSELNAWALVRRLARDILQGVGDLGDRTVKLQAIADLADEMMGQLRRGVHANTGKKRARGRTRVNPSIVTFLAKNPGGMRLIGSEVQLIAYRHAETGGAYVHAFGDGERALRTDRRGNIVDVDLSALPARTGVRFYQDGKRLVLARPDGKPLSGDF